MQRRSSCSAQPLSHARGRLYVFTLATRVRRDTERSLREKDASIALEREQHAEERQIA
jgi:hypothetical protein